MDPATFSRLKAIAIARANQGKDLLPGFIPGNEQTEAAITQKRAEFVTFETNWERETGRYFTVEGKNVAYIPIWGSLTKDGDLCGYGMRDYGQWIMRAENSERINAILLDFNNCPGGTVDGTPELASIIAQTSKPVVSFVDGMAASAGVWLASQTNHIMANSLNFNEIGSIGTLYVHVDARTKIEKEIGKVEIIRATDSVDKARINSFEELREEDRAKLIEELDEINAVFHSAVKSGRFGKLTEAAISKKTGIFSGAMYSSEEAKQLGLIDSIGTFAEALQLAASLASTTLSQRENHSQSKSNKNSMKIKSAWLAMLTFLGFSAALADEGKAELTEEGAEKLNAELTTLQSSLAAFEAEIKQLKAEKDNLAAQVQAHKETIAAHEATIADQKALLEAAPAGNATTVVAEKDKGHEYVNPADKYKTSVDLEKAKLKSRK